MLSSVASLRKSGCSDLPCAARLPSGMPLEIFVGQHALRQRREDDRADAELVQRVEQPVLLDPAVEHRIARLVDEQGVPSSRRIVGGLAGALRNCRTRCRHRAPCPSARRGRARPSSPRAACRGRSGANRRCRHSRGPCASGSGRGWRAGICGCPIRHRARATCRSRPWWR